MSAAAPVSRGVVGLLFAYGFCNAAAYIASRAVADSLFLSHIGPAQLPRMFVLTAIAAAAAATLHARLAERVGTHTLLSSTLSLSAIAYFLLPGQAELRPDSLWIFGGVILLTEIRGVLGSIHLATLLHEHVPGDQSPRVVGVVGLGATLGGLSLGVLVAALSDVLEGEKMLYFSAAFDLAAVALAAGLRGSPRAHRPPIVAPKGDSGQARDLPRLREIWGSPAVRGLALATFAAVTVALLIDFRWKYTIAAVYSRDEHDLTKYFGYFYGGVYLMTGLLQLAVAGKLLERFGPFPCLLAFPSGLLLAVGVTIGAEGKFLLTSEMSLMKGCDALRRGLYDPAVQVVYSRLPESLRRPAIAFLSGVVKPPTEAAVSLTLLFLAPNWSDDFLLGITLGALALWLYLLIRLRPDLANGSFGAQGDDDATS